MLVPMLSRTAALCQKYRSLLPLWIIRRASKERVADQGGKQSHAKNAFYAVTTIVVVLTDAFRRSDSQKYPWAHAAKLCLKIDARFAVES